MVTLQRVTEDNFQAVLDLSVSDDQKSYVATNAKSLAQAWLYGEGTEPFAIYADDTPVGFFLAGIDLDDAEPFYSVWRLMIDQRHQGKGYGKAALGLAIQYLKDRGAQTIHLGCHPQNITAQRMYEKAGFKLTGKVEHGENEMKLELPQEAPSSAVHLREINKDNVADCWKLKVAPGQADFVAPNVYSLAQAYANPDTAHPFAIYAGDTMVGFFMGYVDHAKEEYEVWRIMIGEQYQGKGYGRQALDLAIAYLKSKGAKVIGLSYEPENKVAAAMYAKAGFFPTGEIEDGEAVAKLTLA